MIQYIFLRKQFSKLKIFNILYGIIIKKSDKSLKTVPLNYIRINNEIDIMKIYTKNEVSSHNKEKDCWVILKNDIYNIT